MEKKNNLQKYNKQTNDMCMWSGVGKGTNWDGIKKNIYDKKIHYPSVCVASCDTPEQKKEFK